MIKIHTNDYYIQELRCKCNSCDKEFREYVPLNYELVCFEDMNNKKYFLPTFGENGYLDLLEKHVEDWNSGKAITKKIADCFIEKINTILPYDVHLFTKTKCPNCKSHNIYIKERIIKKNYPVEWLEIKN